MYHPTKWRKLSQSIWEVDDATVMLHKDKKWYCDICFGEQFRLGGRKQFPCIHSRFVMRKEEQTKKVLQQLEISRGD